MTRHAGWTVGCEHPAPLPPQDAVIFDLDGVVSDTMALHARGRGSGSSTR
jgi:hypothetical protein